MRRCIKSDERGFAHLLLIAGALGVVIVVGLAGWAVFGKNKKTPSTTPKTTGSAYANCMAGYHDTKLCQFAAHYQPLAKSSYQATVSVTSPQGTISNLVYSSDGKGDSEVTGTSDGQQLSSIELAGNTFIKVSGSDWIEYPSGATNAPAQTDPTANLDDSVAESNLSFQSLGTAACGSMTCYKYQISEHSQPDATQDIWFDTSAYLLRQWTYHGDTGSTSMTISYQPVSITAPSPVKVITSSNT